MVKAEELNGKYFDVVIIGGGLGGLQCGYILSKKGLKVCVLEQNPLLGGCLQSFHRRGAEFDTGLHYVGGLDEGQSLNSIFKYFSLLDLPWRKMDPDAFDEVIINGKSYMFANGYDNFAARMGDYFPHQRENLKRYTALLKEVGDALPRSFQPKEDGDVYTQSLFAQSAYEYINQTITDPLLREVLAGTSLKMELSPNLPLYTFAQINSSFIQSAYRLNGGGNLIAESLCCSIESMGGVVATRAKATEIKELPENRVYESITENKEYGIQIIINDKIDIFAKNVISNLHPASTLDLIKESANVRKVYRNRIKRLDNTYGIFTLNLSLKEGAVEYLNRNRYLHRLDEGQTLWRNSASEKGSDATAPAMESMLISYYAKDMHNHTQGDEGASSNATATQIDLLTPMRWEEVEKFVGTKIGQRADEYKEIKERWAEQCIEFAQTYIPGLKENIINSYSSTPLTYRDYTATACGSAYGIKKDYSNLMLTLLTPKTPVPNLYLTGQNLNLHGVLGVSMTSFFTSAQIVGMEAAVEGLKFEK